jgi:hypothetical protein
VLVLFRTACQGQRGESNARNATSGVAKSVRVQTTGQRLFIFSATMNKFPALCKMTNKCVNELVDLFMYSRFTPTCFGKWLPSSGGRRCLRSYSSSVCIVVVYRLRSIRIRIAILPYTPTIQTENTSQGLKYLNIKLHPHNFQLFCVFFSSIFEI